MQIYSHIPCLWVCHFIYIKFPSEKKCAASFICCSIHHLCQEECYNTSLYFHCFTSDWKTHYFVQVDHAESNTMVGWLFITQRNTVSNIKWMSTRYKNRIPERNAKQCLSTFFRTITRIGPLGTRMLPMLRDYT